MRYIFTRLRYENMHEWWNRHEPASLLDLDHERHVLASVTHDDRSVMIVSTKGALLGCLREASQSSIDAQPSMETWVVEAQPPNTSAGNRNAALISVTNGNRLVIELEVDAQSVDDVCWYDPDGNRPIRFFSALVELDAAMSLSPDSIAQKLEGSLKGNARQLAEAEAARQTAGEALARHEPLSAEEVRRMITAEAALTASLADLRLLRMQASLQRQSLATHVENVHSALGPHQSTAGLMTERLSLNLAQLSHDSMLIEHAIEQVTAALDHSSSLFDRSRYFIDEARSRSSTLQLAVFAALGMALTTVQVLALPNVTPPDWAIGQLPTLVFAVGSLTFLIALAFSKHAIPRKQDLIVMVGVVFALPVIVWALDRLI